MSKGWRVEKVVRYRESGNAEGEAEVEFTKRAFSNKLDSLFPIILRSRISPFSILSIFRTRRERYLCTRFEVSREGGGEGSWRNENSWNLFGLTRSVSSRD